MDGSLGIQYPAVQQPWPDITQCRVPVVCIQKASNCARWENNHDRIVDVCWFDVLPCIGLPASAG